MINDHLNYQVTIGIPVYNIERYVGAMLESALAQTFSSIEYLIVDDCGTDSSMDIIHRYQQEHPRGKDIRILQQPHNKGIGAARNWMMKEARGRYFYSLDGDDTIAENTIERLYEAAKQYQAELVYGSYERVFVHDGKVVGTKPYPYPDKVFTKPDEYAMYAYYVGVQGMNWNFLIDLNVVRNNKLEATPVAHGYGEDFTYTVDLPTYVTRVVLLSDITYQYYIRTFTGKKKPKKVLQKSQMQKAIASIDQKKRRVELKGKPYYAQRCAKLMMLDCSFACEMEARKADFDIPFTNKEIRDIMWHPMSLGEILRNPSSRMKNLLYYIVGHAPSFVSVWLLKGIEKRYGV